MTIVFVCLFPLPNRAEITTQVRLKHLFRHFVQVPLIYSLNSRQAAQNLTGSGQIIRFAHSAVVLHICCEALARILAVRSRQLRCDPWLVSHGRRASPRCCRGTESPLEYIFNVACVGASTSAQSTRSTPLRYSLALNSSDPPRHPLLSYELFLL
jgi:hypothetical protein